MGHMSGIGMMETKDVGANIGDADFGRVRR